MSCLGCDSKTLSSDQQQLSNIRKKAKEYAEEKNETIIIFVNETGYDFCSERTYRQYNPGQFVEGITQFMPHSSSS